jgi:hypothetical protein
LAGIERTGRDQPIGALEVEQLLISTTLAEEILLGQSFGAGVLKLPQPAGVDLLAAVCNDLLRPFRGNAIVDAAIDIVDPFAPAVAQKVVDPAIGVDVIDLGPETTFVRGLFEERPAPLSLLLFSKVGPRRRRLDPLLVRDLWHLRAFRR